MGIFFILMFTIGNKPGSMHPLIFPFFAYSIVSFILPIFVIIFCILGLIKETKKVLNIICLLLALMYEIIFFSFVVTMWPAWMGI
jgi:4-amino-4-deoxy-L-arabinose transferase-like glycosyltransferase